MRIKKTSQYIEGGAEISNVYGTSQENGYSQEYCNNHFGGVVLYTTPSTISAQTSITFSDISNYSYLEIIFGQTSKANSRSLKIIPSISVGSDISFTIETTDTSTGLVYINTARYGLTSTGLSFKRVTQKELKADNSTSTTTSSTPTNIAIYQIIGYK